MKERLGGLSNIFSAGLSYWSGIIVFGGIGCLFLYMFIRAGLTGELTTLWNLCTNDLLVLGISAVGGLPLLSLTIWMLLWIPRGFFPRKIKGHLEVLGDVSAWRRGGRLAVIISGTRCALAFDPRLREFLKARNLEGSYVILRIGPFGTVAQLEWSPAAEASS